MTTSFSPRSFRALLALLVLAMLASCIAAPWPDELLLQHILTAVFLASWAGLQKRYAFSRSSTLLIAAFLLLHIFGARWLYSNVPYDRWLQACCQTDTRHLFGWTRNHYDRLVHLAYGLCFTLPLAEFFRQRGRTQRDSLLQAVLWIMVSSLFYEWFEWGIALTLSPAEAEGYNGQQGDLWDAHKDMLLATLGSLVAVMTCSRPLYGKDPRKK
ncbi:DUF2238 domain-containing protein [Chitinilyticum piscinae]|uniref:DUF2238 domain-containing protein n=1 Tax=Chitinilyticum piscinae TaxID=2866724 RepID=A0A8J7G0U9_9NEIS|nr:DUF2238 domain-containing protein [Chitinilyticum piscinae]MBE9609905.1 DUF2238 domain-containing protein [Chitinilyticum piscinae]